MNTALAVFVLGIVALVINIGLLWIAVPALILWALSVFFTAVQVTWLNILAVGVILFVIRYLIALAKD
jgi:hypothetical protein